MWNLYYRDVIIERQLIDIYYTQQMIFFFNINFERKCPIIIIQALDKALKIMGPIQG